MDSGCRLIFDPTPSRQHRGGHMLLLGRGANPIFQGARSFLDMEAAASNKRRLPFLITSPDDLLEEDYYDEQLPEKKRRLTPEQVQMLEVSFETENKLEPERKTELARSLGLQPRQVAVWFQNRRARCKTKQLEQDFDRLKSSYDALVTDNDTLRMDNDRLRSQVISLAEKLENTVPSGDTMGLNYKRNQALQQQERVEDRLSAVVEGEGRQVVDSSGESYFHENYQGGCVIGIQSEDDGSDEGCSYLPADILEVGQNNDVGLWMWN